MKTLIALPSETTHSMANGTIPYFRPRHNGQNNLVTGPKEIPNPKDHSGDSPDYTLIPIPRRFQEYSTDLRAMVVFNSLMSSLLNQ
jgi:hypothetical protein